MLNLNNAREYLERTVQGATVLEPRGFEYLKSCEGTAVISLNFTLPEYAGNIFTMEIWLEDGALYGEW